MPCWRDDHPHVVAELACAGDPPPLPPIVYLDSHGYEVFDLSADADTGVACTLGQCLLIRLRDYVNILTLFKIA